MKIINFRICQQYLELVEKLRYFEHYKLTDEYYNIKKENEKYDYALLNRRQKSKDKTILSCSLISTANSIKVSAEDSGELIIKSTGRLYDIDVSSEQSGSPVFLKANPNRLVGIYKDYVSRANKNIYCLICADMAAELKEWAR